MIRSRKLLAGARDQSCVNCGASDGTIVSAHYSGMRSYALGKGRGIKPHDLFIADLCSRCHSSFDGGTMATISDDKYMRKLDQSEQFLFLVLMTLQRRMRQGILKVDDWENE